MLKNGVFEHSIDPRAQQSSCISQLLNLTRIVGNQVIDKFTLDEFDLWYIDIRYYVHLTHISKVLLESIW